MPAWPPGASRSITIVRRPSDAPYTAAASPAGPAPTMTVSYSAATGSVGKPEELGHAAQLRSHHRLAVDDAQHGTVVVLRERAVPMIGRVRRAGLEPPERDLVSVEEVPELRA